MAVERIYYDRIEELEKENKKLREIKNKHDKLCKWRIIAKAEKKRKSLWFNLYHGLQNPDFIGVKKEDYMKILEKARAYDRLR